MELYLQFGHGMKTLTIDLAKRWGKATVILSPRDMTEIQLVNWCKDFKKNNVSCLFDPQCYCPKTEPKRLSKYSYWDNHLKTNTQTNNTILDERISEIKKYNDTSETIAYIIPNILMEYDDSWQKNWLRS